MRFEDQTVFITGAGSGLGRAAAERFGAEGATVVAADVDADAAGETVDRLADAGVRATAHELDVRDAEEFAAAIEATVETHGLDVVLNNAGIVHDRVAVESIDEDVYEQVVGVNVTGVWNGTRAAIPYLKEQGSGAIVNTASLAGVIGAPKLSAYSLSKGAVVNFTRAVAAEVGPHGVRVNAVCPGVTDTPMPREGMTDEEWAAVRDQMAEQYPLRRLGRPEDVANAMSFLASDEADWITGEALVVDGGFSCA